MSRHIIHAVLDAAEWAGLGWDDVVELSEAEVYAALFPGRGVRESVFAQPDWARARSELARVGVTLKLLHQYHDDAFSRAGQAVMSGDRFCRLYGEHAAVTGVSSRIGHKAGRSVEVDCSGPTMQLLDPTRGEISKVYLFVACLPFSRYAFVEATLDMRRESWLRANAAMFAFFGGSMPRLVPDNLKIGVITRARARLFSTMLTAKWWRLFSRGIAGPRPGAKGQSERREHGLSCRDLAQLRGRIAEQIVAYNRRPFQKRDGSRLSVFFREEKPLIQPLLAAPFEIRTWSYKRNEYWPPREPRVERVKATALNHESCRSEP
ncbi:hypothetical protein [Cryobacterium sp. Y29]|uniref:hypothetical protein n=1 Tax=Cryobacterium sp. Y29 TaxID=2048285 RepID=UPI000CE4291D|nr:hypothetical protein [Cryobacterium sp. Y29]